MKEEALLLLLAAFPLILGDLFESFDQNHDGLIDRKEYGEGMAKIAAALGGSTPEYVSFMSQLHISKKFWRAFISGVAMIPIILPKQSTPILGGILFLYFGIMLVSESRSMEANRVSEELEEVEELLHEKKREVDEEQPNGISQPKPRKLNWSQVFCQSLALTFLAEWGDRSQIATIALSAAKNPYGVTFGGCLGHMMCTGIAVMGGRMLAARISEKTVAFWGGIIFLIVRVHSIFF